MPGVYKGLTIKIGTDDGDLQRALDRNTREANKLKRELKNVEKGLKLDTTSPQMLASKMQKVTDQAKRTEDRLKLLRQAESEIGKEKMRTDQWVSLQGEIAEAEAKLRAYRDQLRELAAEQAANGSALGKAGNFLMGNAETFQTVGDGMQKVGGLLTRTVTPAIAGGAAASVKAAVDIDTALTGVRKTVDGTEEDYQRLKDAAIEFSKTNATSATDFLDAQALGAQLGFAIDELQQFAEVATGLDIATNMDLETAGSEMARFANITKMSHGDIENYASAIVNVGNNMATTESEVSAMAMRLAAAGTQVGMSQADILGLAGALSSLGVEAEAGGTAISTVMATIDKEVATGGEGLETWAATAKMSADDFSAAWKSDPVEALSAVLSGMEEATAEGSNMSIMLEDLGISSLRQTDILKRLAGNSQIMADGVRIANEGWRENTALSEEVANRNDSMAAKFEMLKNRIVAVAEEVGEPIADALLEAVDAAEPLFEAIENGARAFSEMSDEEQKAVLQTAGFLAVLGPMTTGIGKVVSSLGGAGGAMVNLAKGLAKVDMAGFAGGASKAATAASGASKAVEGIGAASKVASVGMGALKTVGILAIVAGLALAVKEAKDYFDHMQLVEKAAGGVRDAMSETFSGGSSPSAAFEDAAEGADGYRSSLDELRDSHQKTLEANARLADSISTTFEEAGSKQSVIDNFKRSLDELEGSAAPTERQLADTKIAIDQMNEAFGTSFQLAQDADGNYTVITEEAAEAARQIDELRSGLGENAQLTEDQLAELQGKVSEINEQFGTTYEVAGSAEEGYRIVGDAADGAREKVDSLVASLERQNSYEAFSSLAKESNEALQTASSNLQKQQAALADAEEYLAGLQSRLAENPNDLMLEGQVLAATSAVEGLKQTVSEAEGAYQSATAASEAFASAQNLMQQAMDANSSALTQAVADNDLLVNSFIGAGKDVASFKDTLEAAGASAEGLSKIGSKEAAQLAKAYDGSFTSIESLLATFGVEVDENARDALRASEEHQRAAKATEDSWREAFASMGGDFDAVGESVGQSASVLSARLEGVGLSVEDLATVGAEGFARLYEAADGNTVAVMETINRLNELGIDQKSFQVTDEGTIADKYGNLIDLDAMTIGGKPFYVDDNGTIQTILGEIKVLDDTFVEDKDFHVNNDGTVTVSNEELAALDGVKIGDKHYRVVTEGAEESKRKAENVKAAADRIPKSTNTAIRADDQASGKIQSVDRQMGWLNGKTSTVNVNANTSAAWSELNALANANPSTTLTVYKRVVEEHASGGILPRHMAGGIFTGPTLTNIGLVGEAGAEAWLDGPGGSGALVPLTNRRYVRPFAQAVASEMGAGGRTVNVNVNLNYTESDDAARMARDVARRLELIMDMEG